jgi:hypothetical protein
MCGRRRAPSAGSTSYWCGVRPCGRGAAGRRGAIVPGMAEMIVAFLGTTAWVGGVLVIIVMATLPLLEHVADVDRR